MPNARAKRAVLRSLQSVPDFSALSAMPSLRGGKGMQLLRWLDQSGLALSLLGNIPANSASNEFPVEWRDALEQRRERNAIRLKDMLQEFRRLNEAFRTRGVLAVTLKGFYLVPDFCADLRHRHQTDFDFLVDPASVETAAEVLQSLGYSTTRLSHTEESCFTPPLRHIPSYYDDLYSSQHHPQVDLRVSLTEKANWIDMDVPGDCLPRAVPSSVGGVDFYAPSLADRFVG